MADGRLVRVPATSSAAAQRERNLRFLSLWNPFLPFVLGAKTLRQADSTERPEDGLFVETKAWALRSQ